MEKVKKLILVIFLIVALTLNVNAEYLWNAQNPPNMILGYYDNLKITTSGSNQIYNMFGTIYPLNGTMDWVSTNIPDQSTGQPFAYMAFWQSVIQYNTVYKFSVKLDWSESVTPEPETGIIPERTNQFVALVPFERTQNLDATKVGVTQTYKVQNLKQYDLNGSTIYNGMYHMFYDSTSDMLSVVFIADNTVNTKLVQTNNYVYIVLGDNNYSAVTNFTVTEYTGIVEADEKTKLLRDIADQLESMAGAAGGLTEEQVNQAIQDALNAHDQQLEQELSSKLDQILDQISGITEPYKQAVDQITGTLANVSNIFAYSGTDAVLTLPAAVNPLAGNAVLWQAQQIDLGAAYNTMPSSLRILLQYALRAAVLLAVLNEVINIIKYAIIGGDRGD